MEDILDTYEKPYDARIPVVCMDEQLVQLICETRIALSVEPGQPKSTITNTVETGQQSTWCLLNRWQVGKIVDIRQSKTMINWAQEIRNLLDCDYPEAEKVILVSDNLNTDKIASLYETFLS